MRPGTKKTLSLLSYFLIVWFSIRFFLPLFSPFLIGAGLALTAEPTVRFLTRRLRLPRSVGAGIGVGMTFCLVCILLLLLLAFMIRELKALAGVIPDLEATVSTGVDRLQLWLEGMASRTPQSIRPILLENIRSAFSDGAAVVDGAAGYLLSLAGSLLSHVPDSALGLGTAVISGFMISAKLPRIRSWLLKRIPREKLRSILEAGKRIRNVAGKWLMAQAKLMGVTFVILFLGFVILRIPYALLWATGVALVDAFPVLGTGTVLLPWSLITALQGDTPRAIGLLGVYASVTLIRSALEPKLVGRQLGLDPLVTLIALYVGYKIWGILGMILAPLLTVTAIQVVPRSQREEG